MFGWRRSAPRRAVSDAEFAELQRAGEIDWREHGPFDVDEVELNDGVTRLNWGPLIITPWAGLTLVAFPEDTPDVESVLFNWDNLVMEITLFADSKEAKVATAMLPELQQFAGSRGGHVRELEGPMGPEYHVVTPLATGESQEFQRVRIWLASGPNWLLRASLLDEAALLSDDDPRLRKLLAGFRAICVDRGKDPMPPGAIVMLRRPDVDSR